MPDALSLSVVEQSPVRKGGTGADALRESIALAVACESLGYRRFWVAEHHSLGGIASTSPEILIGQIGAATSRIRVGSGGVMLPHYSAFKVAENFRMLETLFPGRIDLGLGRAPGGDPRTMHAMSDPRPPIDVRAYPQQIDDLVGYLGDDLPPGHPFAGLQPGPPTPGVPDVWLLGSGVDSARIAAARGLPFSFAHFFGHAAQGPAIAELYRSEFRPSPSNPEPRVHVAVQVMCAETREEAEWHARSLAIGRLQMARGQERAGIVSPEEAAEHRFTPEEEAFLARSGLRATVGSPTDVQLELEAIAKDYRCDELGLVTICFDFEARKRSYQLVAERFAA
jgi:luciferase family oxidoreductase group 1